MRRPTRFATRAVHPDADRNGRNGRAAPERCRHRRQAAWIAALGLFFLAGCANLQPHTHTTPSLWRISDPDSDGVIYLLGSIHVGPAAGWHYPDAVLSAFAASSTLIVEVDVLDEPGDDILRQMLAKGTLPAELSLSEEISPETWQRTRAALATAGIPEAAAQRMKPWLLALSLSQVAVQGLGLHAERGVDLDFLRRARGSKRVIALESIEFQLELFDSMDPTLQEMMLLDTLMAIGELESFIPELMEAWRLGDEARISLLVQDGLAERPELQPFYDIVFDQRNRSMSDRLDPLLRGGGSHFAVVGILHVVGDTGIVALLTERGFIAERVNTY